MLRLIDLHSGQEICRFPTHKRTLLSFLVSQDGKTVATGDGEKVIVWDLQAPPGSQIRKHGVDLSREELQALWQDLDAMQAKRAYFALLQMTQGGDPAVRFLRERLTAAPAPKREQINELINDLNAESFARREGAQRALANMGRMAEASVQKAFQQNPSAGT